MFLGRDCIVRAKSRNSGGYVDLHSPKRQLQTRVSAIESRIFHIFGLKEKLEQLMRVFLGGLHRKGMEKI